MPWRLTIPSVPRADFDQTIAMVLNRDLGKLSGLGASHAAEIATEAVKSLVDVWDVAQVPGRTIGAIISGHANPSGNAPEGFENDWIDIRIWRSS